MANNDIIELLDVLYGMVTEAWSVPLGNDKCIIEREKAIEIINEIKVNLPTAIAEAQRLEGLMRAPDDVQRLAHALLGLAHQIVHIFARDPSELLGFVLRRGDHLAASGPGDADNLLFLDHLVGLLLRVFAQGLRLPLGVADKLIARRDETLSLRNGCGQAVLDLVDDLDSLLPLDDALVIAERHTPCLGDHAV